MSLLEGCVRIPFLKVLLKKIWVYEDAALSRKIMGLTFKNPIGLAAGFDKNAEHIDALACLGFGFIEVGTVTPVAQEGNPKPRLFRLPNDRALINRMGFNNRGTDAMVALLKARKKTDVIVGGNIGKNKMTPNEVSVKDYEISFTALYPWVDYFVVNVSSPNTPGLRDLQEKEPLLRLLRRLQKINQDMDDPKPILLKIAPDLELSQIDDVIEVIQASNLDGLIATNTTISREGLATKTLDAIGAGGLSGQPLAQRSTEIIRYLRQNLGPGPVIIGVGGIDSVPSAKAKLDAGADLIQIYSGLIYEGPNLIKEIAKSIAQS